MGHWRATITWDTLDQLNFPTSGYYGRVGIVSALSELTATNSTAFEYKVMGLLGIYAYAFFKFGWAYRMFNFGSILLGALNGYALSFWRVRGANLLYGVLMLGCFIPYQVMMYPLVRMLASISLFSSLPGIVLIHTAFGMPVMTLLFRNYYASIPIELFKAARVDGGSFLRIFFELMLPMSVPIIIVAVIMQVTAIWNDYILGLVFAGRDNLPMTVQLNNVINTTTGERLYNVNMAATILTSLVPLTIYLFSGRWFVRGIAAGSVKG